MASCATQIFTFRDKSVNDMVSQVFIIDGNDFTRQVVNISNICEGVSNILSISFVRVPPHRIDIRKAHPVIFKQLDNSFPFLRLMSIFCLR